jgi:hypothetical protein
MKSIKFSSNELEFIRNHYGAELVAAEEYIKQVKEILIKIGKSPTLEETIEIVPKKRGRKAKVKVVEFKEPKKRGRKPKAAVPTPVAELPKKRGRKPKAVPTPEKAELTVATPVAKKGTKKVTPKPKKTTAKPKVTKKAVIKKVPKVNPITEAVPTSEVKQAPKKEVKKVVKKKNQKRRAWKGSVRLAPLSKPLTRKNPVPEPVSENPPAVEPIIVPTEEPKE